MPGNNPNVPANDVRPSVQLPNQAVFIGLLDSTLMTWKAGGDPRFIIAVC